jgi:hypothetical protein
MAWRRRWRTLMPTSEDRADPSEDSMIARVEGKLVAKDLTRSR